MIKEPRPKFEFTGLHLFNKCAISDYFADENFLV